MAKILACRRLVGCFSMIWVLVIARASAASDAAQTLAPGAYEIFNPTNIPDAQEDYRGDFKVKFTYSARDWEPVPQQPKPGRIPPDPSQFQQIVLAHRTVPAVLMMALEKVETTADADPVTLAKILRYNREANAKFRVLSESSRSIGAVEGAQTEYVQLRHGQLMRVRHWTAHYNGIAYQLQLIVPYDAPDLMKLGGAQGFPLLVNFLDPRRDRPVLKDADIPRTFESPYGYRINLGEGEWIPGAEDSIIYGAEYVAYTRNQGGIAVVPVSTLGQSFDSAALLDAAVRLSDLSTKGMEDKPRPVTDGNLQGVTFGKVFGDEDDMYRLRVKAVSSTNRAYLAIAWINTNNPLGPGVLDQWLAKVTFPENASLGPTNAHALVGFREKNRVASGLLCLGEHYMDAGDLDHGVEALRLGMDCRFFPDIFWTYAAVQERRGHPEEIITFVQSRGSVALRTGWVVMELAHAESRVGDTGKAAAHYTQALSAGGYGAGGFRADYFEDYVRCLIKLNRAKWASDRLKERMKVDPSPLWPKMLAELNQSQPGVVPPRTAVPAKPEPARTGPPELKNVIWNEHMPSAQLDSTLVFQGDQVRGYKVVKIHQDNVELTTPEGASLVLHLNSGNGTK